MFHILPWREPQVFMHNRFSTTNNEDPQDTKQVWFAGVHADIGGGYPEAESALSKYPLIWMIDEAARCGLSVDRRTVNHLAWGVKRKGSPFNYVAPDYRGTLHDLLRSVGNPLRSGPRVRPTANGRGEGAYSATICLSPNPEPFKKRVHSSVLVRRTESVAYKPINLPKSFEVVPMEGMNDS